MRSKLVFLKNLLKCNSDFRKKSDVTATLLQIGALWHWHYSIHFSGTPTGDISTNIRLHPIDCGDAANEIILLLRSQEEGKILWWVWCLFVCPLAYLRNNKAELHPIFLHINCCYGSLLWWHCGTLYTSRFVNDVRFWTIWHVICILNGERDSITAEITTSI